MGKRVQESGPRPRLAVFLSGLWGGGAQRRMLTLAQAFAERGHSVDVVVVCPEGPFRRLVSPLVRLVVLDTSWVRFPGVRSHKGLWVMAAAPALTRYLCNENPDVVLATSNPANLTALWARRWAGVATPVVVSVNVHLSGATGERQRVWGTFLRALVRRWYPSADAIIAISRGVAEDLQGLLKVPPERIVTIFNPVDVDDIQRQAREPVDHPWVQPGAPPLVLGVGKLKIQKDFPTLLKAFAHVRARQPAHLMLLGEGEEQSNLERLGRDLGITEDLALPGFVENPFSWMAHASVLVLSSAWEGFSNVLAEALACGCSVVSTDCPSGPSEILDRGAYGPLVPVGDHQALAEAILAVLKKPVPRGILRARARVFSVDAAADQYLEVLLRVARQSELRPEAEGCGVS